MNSSSTCPSCRQRVRPPISRALTDWPCPHCGLPLWYVHVEDVLFVFDRNRLSGPDWLSLIANIPTAADDSVGFVEKLLVLEGHAVR